MSRLHHQRASMCNNYAVTVSWAEYLKAFSTEGLSVDPDLAAPNLAPEQSLWPTDRAPVIRATSPGSVELVRMRWGFAPPGPKAGPIINFRSENRTFTHGRCLAPADCFFEYTGSRAPKTRWRISSSDGSWFALAALWRRGSTDDPDSFSLLTTAPGPDIAPIHNRQVAIIHKSLWRDWLDPAIPSCKLLHPSPAGSLKVEIMSGAEPVQGRLF